VTEQIGSQHVDAISSLTLLFIATFSRTAIPAVRYSWWTSFTQRHASYIIYHSSHEHKTTYKTLQM